MNNIESMKKRKITVASPYKVYPPITGAPLRIFHLYKNLTKWFDIELITYANYGSKLNKAEIYPGLWEISVPKSYAHYKEEMSLYKKMRGSAFEYSLINLYKLSPEYLFELEKSSMSSEVVVSSEPYLFLAIKKVTRKKIWYDSHNVEYELQKSILEKSNYSSELLMQIKNIEEECCKVSELIMVCSSEDKRKMSTLYNINLNKIFVVPNGTESDNIKCIVPNKRDEIRYKYNINKNFVAFFIGAYYKPNIRAVEYIIEMAKQLSNVYFIISGSVCNHLKDRSLPSNIKITGQIDERKKNLLLSYADVALNPMMYGSGTNLKMLEYFAYGIPVITTPVGARGLGVENKKHCLICEIDEFNKTILDFKKYSQTKKDELAINARKHVESEFNWRVIGERTYEYISGAHVI